MRGIEELPNYVPYVPDPVSISKEYSAIVGDAGNSAKLMFKGQRSSMSVVDIERREAAAAGIWGALTIRPSVWNRIGQTVYSCFGTPAGRYRPANTEQD